MQYSVHLHTTLCYAINTHSDDYITRIFQISLAINNSCNCYWLDNVPQTDWQNFANNRYTWVLTLELPVPYSWWRHPIEIFSVSLAFGAGNSPVTGEFPAQRPVTRNSVSLICAWINGWVNNREAGDLRHHRAHYDVTVMLVITLLADVTASNSAKASVGIVMTEKWNRFFFKLHWVSMMTFLHRGRHTT